MADSHPPPRDYSYGDHASQFVRLHLPETGDRLPVVLVIHGGFWRQRYGIEYADPLCRNLI
ncbi:MAG: alpha/beta hydrolase, partial [Nakamurella sp.]